MVDLCDICSLRDVFCHPETSRKRSIEPPSDVDLACELQYLRNDRSQIWDELVESEARFRDLYENSPIAYFTVGLDGHIQSANRYAARLTGYQDEELRGKHILSLYADTQDGKEKAIEILERFKEGEEIRDEELQMQRADGSNFWISLSVNSLHDRNGQVKESRSIVVDITERKRLEAEQIRLARDLHDTVSGTLYGLIAMANVGRTMIKRGSQEDIENAFNRLGHIGQQAVRELRMFLYQMRPSLLAEDGLKNAIEHRLASVEARSNAEINIFIDETIVLPAHIEEALFFITQEALNNAVKHSLADAIEVSLEQVSENKFELEIADNGRGFDPTNTREIGMGLSNMRARAKGITGELKLSSQVGEGTRIKVDFVA